MTTPRSYVEKELSEDPPLDQQRTSGFRWDDVFGGFEDGKVFTVPEPEIHDYREMLNTDGKAASLEKMLSFPIIAAGWQIDPAKSREEGDIGAENSILNSGKNDEIVAFIYDALTDLPHQGGPRTTIEQLVSQMTMAFTEKRAYFEKVFKVNEDDKVVYDKIQWVPPETCELALDAKTGDIRGFRHTPVQWHSQSLLVNSGRYQHPQYVDIPMKSAFIYTHGTWRDPIFGYSAMRVPYWCYVTKRKLRWLWYQFLDQTYLPKTIVKNPDDRQAISDARKVATLRSKGVVGLNSLTDVEAFESGGHGAAGYVEAIRFLDSEMSHSILAGFTDLTSAAAEGKGSYALSESQSKLFLRTRRMVARDMARQITNDVIGPLVRYNFGRKAMCPRFTFGPVSEQNEQAVLDMFKAVATTGAKVPPEFFDELIVRVSTLLELDPGKVKKNMEEMPETPGELGLLGQQVEVATAMVDGAQQQGIIPPSPIGPPPGGAADRRSPTAPGTDSIATRGANSSTARKARRS